MTLALLLAAVVAAQPVADAGPRRFAIAVGNNRGLGGDPPLRYAERDARAMLGVLEDVGGLRGEDGRLLLGVDADAVRAELARFARHLQQAARPGDQLFVYFSSHAEAGELHLSGTHLPLREVVRFLEGAPVSVALLVVDSCQSGEAARLKGLKPLPGVRMSVEQPEIAGRVIITASAADESAQESDALAGSLFTHHLVAALRGAADKSGDGRVTLAEAYAYSYARTVEASLLSRAGAQHPSFRFDLQGEGDLVLTAPARASSQLTLAIDEPGDWTVSTLNGEPFLGHVRKGAGAATLALPPGGYLLTTRGEREALVARVQVPASGRAELTRAQLVSRELSTSAPKGPESLPAPRDGWWMLHVGPSIGSPLVSTFGMMAGGTAQLQYVWKEGVLNVVSATLEVRHGQYVLQGLLQNDHALRVGVGHFERDSYGIEFQLTAEVGGVLARQWQPGRGDATYSLVPYVGAAGGLWMPVGESLRLGLFGNVGPARVRTASHVGASWVLGSGLGLGWAW